MLLEGYIPSNYGQMIRLKTSSLQQNLKRNTTPFLQEQADSENLTARYSAEAF